MTELIKKDQHKEKKGKNMDREAEIQKDERFFLLIQKFVVSILVYFKIIMFYY